MVEEDRIEKSERTIYSTSIDKSRSIIIDDLQLDEHIPWYFAQMIFQSASNGAILLMQDLLNVDIRMNYPGKGK